MLLTKTVKVRLSSKTLKYYEDLGYEIPRVKDKYYRLRVPRGTMIEVKVEDLKKGSNAIVQWQCDGENCDEIITGTYQNYCKYVKEDGKIYCNTCSKNGGKFCSILQYAIDNNRLTELNIRKNYELGIDLNKIPYRGMTMIWCLCDKKDYHNDFGGYIVSCNNFSKGSGCPYCANQKVHPLDSVGQDIINNYGEDFLWKVWSDKNTISPFELSPGSNTEVWWNCHKGEHDPYLRNCNYSKKSKYKCPECYEHLKGENNPRWNPNKTDKERGLDRKYSDYVQFIKDVMARDNYTCQITGIKSNGHNLVVHHLNGYNWDKDNRTNPDNGIVLCEDIHKLFHHIYGYGDNTAEQFEEFLMNIEYGNIDISNIN